MPLHHGACVQLDKHVKDPWLPMVFVSNSRIKFGDLCILEHWQSEKGPRRGFVIMTVSFFGYEFWPLDLKMYRYLFLIILRQIVWNIKAVYLKLLKLLCQNQSVENVQLWPWPLEPKMYRYLPLNILHLCMKYESCSLKTTQVIVSEPKCWRTAGRKDRQMEKPDSYRAPTYWQGPNTGQTWH